MTHSATKDETFKEVERQNVIANGLDPEIWCVEPTSSRWNSAMAVASKQIEETFRPERKQRQHIISQGHHVHELVEGKRYSFAKACRLMEVDAALVAETVRWLDHDNCNMNAKFSTQIHRLRDYDFALANWMLQQQKAQPIAEVISIRGAV